VFFFFYKQLSVKIYFKYEQTVLIQIGNARLNLR